MKGLTIWQPWATLLACGAKEFETRSWPCKYRGWVAIHAGKTQDVEAQALCQTKPFATPLAKAGYESFTLLPFGKIVGIAEMVDCRCAERLQLSAQERTFGDFRAGRFAFRFRNARLLATPIEYPGSQGFFDIPEYLAKKLIERANRDGTNPTD